MAYFFFFNSLGIYGREFWKAAVVLCFLEEVASMRLRAGVWSKEFGLKPLYIIFHFYFLNNISDLVITLGISHASFLIPWKALL